MFFDFNRLDKFKIKSPNLYLKGTRKFWKLKKVEKMKTNKPSVLEEKKVKKDWLRTKEVAENYGIGESTVYYWRKKGLIKNWKKLSPRVTLYSSKELDKLFSPSQKIQLVKNRRKTEEMLSKQKKRFEKNVKSDEEFIAEYLRKQKAKKKRKQLDEEINSWESLTMKNKLKPISKREVTPRGKTIDKNNKGNFGKYFRKRKGPIHLKELLSSRK